MEEKKNNVEVEVKASGSLMKKTKAQLVEIILRKDDVELKYREELKDRNETINTLNSNYTSLYKENKRNINRMKELDKSYNIVEDDFHRISDELATVTCESNNKLKHKNNIIYVLVLLFMCSMVLNILTVF